MAVLLLFSVSSFMFANAKDVNKANAVEQTDQKIVVTLEPLELMTANAVAQTMVVKGSINVKNVKEVVLYIDNDKVESTNVLTEKEDQSTAFTISVDYKALKNFDVKVMVELNNKNVYQSVVTVQVIQPVITNPETTVIETADEEMNYPAAPAIATAYLKELGKPNRYEGTNIISLVAKEATLKAMNKEDAGFEAAVKAYVDAKIVEIDAKAAAAATTLTAQKTVKTTPTVKVSEKANENANENAGKKTK